MTSARPNTWALLLAAGASSRLGRPKQLVPVDGVPLVRRTALALLEILPDRVLCVTGCEAEEVERALAELPVHWARNERWAEGLGSSIAAGVSALPDAATGVLLATCDQALLDAEDFRAVLDARTGDRCAAARYGAVLGVPAYFPDRCFERLRECQGDRGARAILAAEPDVTPVDLPHAAFDVDTPRDLATLMHRCSSD